MQEYDYNNEFRVKQDHIELLRHMVVEWNEGEGLGAPTISVKRPYGNSNILKSVHKILGFRTKEMSEDEEDYAETLHFEMEIVLAIYLSVAGSMEPFLPGKYIKEDRFDPMSWTRAQKKKRQVKKPKFKLVRIRK